MPPAPNNWSELEPLIDRVLDTPPSEWPALIARLSGGDAARRAELERLVAECSAGDALFDRPAAEQFAALMSEMPQNDYERYIDDLARKRAPFVAAAAQLLADDKFDEAERTIRSVDASLYAEREIAWMYRRQLERLAAGGISDVNKSRAEAVFHRALEWALRAYPEPHTEVEAEEYDKGRRAERAQLLSILGYEP